ncbi:MAG: DNA alkylation repair protein [Gemmatimonadaceae bacterium]|nr:DNA alkylation repair protein [Gemmatimonadaceae bacterium]
MTQVAEILEWLRRHGSQRNIDGMARYGIVSRHPVMGVSVGDLQRYAKTIGRDHALALALWRTKIYEARMLCAWIDDPERVTSAQMDRWARDFDNWAICDTMVMHCFDRSPFAWAKVRAWSTSKDEFVKRAAFALVASMAVHHKQSSDATFRPAFKLIARAATDDRNFVKKAVNWALRAVGRRSPALRTEAIALANVLAARDEPSARWIGKDALRDFARVAARKKK